MEYIKGIVLVLLTAGCLSASLKNIITKRDIYLGSVQFVVFIMCLTMIITVMVSMFISAHF